MSALDEIQTVIDQNQRLQRMVDQMAEELEHTERGLDKANQIIIQAGDWMDRHYGSNFDRLPDAIQGLIDKARKLRGGQENERN
jgi:uncharacterized protein YllA (UPF0747 family)